MDNAKDILYENVIVNYFVFLTKLLAFNVSLRRCWADVTIQRHNICRTQIKENCSSEIIDTNANTKTKGKQLKLALTSIKILTFTICNKIKSTIEKKIANRYFFLDPLWMRQSSPNTQYVDYICIYKRHWCVKIHAIKFQWLFQHWQQIATPSSFDHICILNTFFYIQKPTITKT